jgi:hypothetical protein
MTAEQADIPGLPEIKAGQVWVSPDTNINDREIVMIKGAFVYYKGGSFGEGCCHINTFVSWVRIFNARPQP